MARSMLLIHSPLVGPSTWSTLVPVAEAAGFVVAAPDLTGVADAAAPRWQWFVERAVSEAGELDGPITIVGHSGAGVMLPSIAAALGDRCVMAIYLDAIVPMIGGVHRTPAQLVDMLDRQTVDGLLNPWLTWWPDDVIAELLPDAGLRSVLLADMPRLPRSFYDEVVPLPDGWSDGPCAYVQLSPAYLDDHRAAWERGWPTAALDSTHLAIVTEPARVVAAIVDVIGR